MLAESTRKRRAEVDRSTAHEESIQHCSTDQQYQQTKQTNQQTKISKVKQCNIKIQWNETQDVENFYTFTDQLKHEQSIQQTIRTNKLRHSKYQSKTMQH